MTLIQDPPSIPGGPSPTRPPVLRLCDSLCRALDSLAESPMWVMSPGEQAEALVELKAQRARLEELELRVFAAADRNQVARESWATSTPAWLADRTKTTRSSCFRDLRLAQALDEEFEATRRVLAGGAIDA